LLRGEEESGHGVKVIDDNPHMLEAQHAHSSPTDRGERVERRLPTGPDPLDDLRLRAANVLVFAARAPDSQTAADALVDLRFSHRRAGRCEPPVMSRGSSQALWSHTAGVPLDVHSS
jgi:hypothetical protein